jgi:hypothetical protein
LRFRKRRVEYGLDWRRQNKGLPMIENDSAFWALIVLLAASFFAAGIAVAAGHDMFTDPTAKEKIQLSKTAREYVERETRKAICAVLLFAIVAVIVAAFSRIH